MIKEVFFCLAFITMPVVAQTYMDLPGRNDSQATPVFQNKTSPWLKGVLMSGRADIPFHGQVHPGGYLYFHLDQPINFAALAVKDNFSVSQNHVYDLSLSSDDPNIREEIRAGKGRHFIVRGKLFALPTGGPPTSLNMSVEDIKEVSH